MWQCQTRVCQLKPVLFILGSDCWCESCSRVAKFATRIHTVRVHCRGYRFQNSRIGFLKDEFQTMNKTMCLCIKTRLTFLEFHCVLLLNGLEIIYVGSFSLLGSPSFDGNTTPGQIELCNFFFFRCGSRHAQSWGVGGRLIGFSAHFLQFFFSQNHIRFDFLRLSVILCIV